MYYIHDPSTLSQRYSTPGLRKGVEELVRFEPTR